MAKVYLNPDDRVEALCTLMYGVDREFHQPEIVDSATLRYFREDKDHEEGGEWFQVRYDFSGSRDSNPKWGRLWFDEDNPGY